MRGYIRHTDCAVVPLQSSNLADAMHFDTFEAIFSSATRKLIILVALIKVFQRDFIAGMNLQCPLAPNLGLLPIFNGSDA